MRQDSRALGRRRSALVASGHVEPVLGPPLPVGLADQVDDAGGRVHVEDGVRVAAGNNVNKVAVETWVRVLTFSLKRKKTLFSIKIKRNFVISFKLNVLKIILSFCNSIINY